MNEARDSGACGQCGGLPVLSRRLDGGGWRALYWCTRCERAAYGGDSFIRCDREHLEKLPVVTVAEVDSKQGSLF